MKNLICALVVCAAPALFAAAPAITFGELETVLTVTPGATIAYQTTARGTPVVRYWSSLETDADGDGTIHVKNGYLPEPVSRAVIATDVATGQYTYATQGIAPKTFPHRLGAILRGPSGAYTEIVLPYANAEIVWVRAGVGVWKLSVSRYDVYTTTLATYLAHTTDFSVMTGGAVPAGFERGDLLHILYQTQGATLGTVDENLDDTSPGVVSFLDSENLGEGKPFVVTLMRLRNTNAAASVRLEIGDGTGEGVYYQPFDPVVRFAPGEIYREITIQTIDDQVWSGAYANIPMRLTSLDGVTAGTPSEWSFSVRDNDPQPILSMAPTPAEVVETDAPATLPITITREHATRLPATVIVDWELEQAGNRIAEGSTLVTVAPDQTATTIQLPLTGDDVFKGRASLTVTIEDPRNSVLRNYSDRRVVKIREDELPQVSVTGNSVLEGHFQYMTAAQIKAVPYLDSDRPAALSWRTVDGTAKAGRDYEAQSGTFTSFNGNQSIQMKTIQDEEIEGDEVFYIEIFAVTGATILNERGTVTIRDNSQPEVTIGSPTVMEGKAGTRNDLSLRLYFSGPTLGPSVLTLVRETLLSSSATPGRDYDASFEGVPINVPAGRTFVDVVVPILGDDDIEGVELLRLTTGTRTGFRGTKGGIITIQDDDTPEPPQVTVLNGATAYDEGPNARATFTIQKVKAEPGPLKVAWRTEDGTATAGRDYVAASGTVDLSDTKRSEQIVVNLIDDGDDENDETFSIVLHTPVNATIVNARATAVIRDNDEAPGPPPALAVNDITAGEKDGSATFTLTLSAAWPSPVVVEYTTDYAFRFVPTDFVPVEGNVTFLPGERTKTITVPVFDDPFYDPGETIELLLWSGVAIVPAVPPVCKVVDDEGPPKRRPSRH